MNRGNLAMLERNADGIVAAFRAGTPFTTLARQYSVAFQTLDRLLRRHIGDDERAEIIRRIKVKASRNAGNFRRGNIPWNAGMKGWQPPGCEATQFKPGCMRGQAARRYRSVGSVTIRRARVRRLGRPTWRLTRWIKVTDDMGVRVQYRYVPLARWLWEKSHGPIPPGHLVVHIDGDSLNDEPANYRLVNRRGHITLQKARDPQMEERRKRAMKRRRRVHHIKGVKDRKRQVRAAREIWQCPACAHELPGEPAANWRCPKCDGFTAERIEVPTKAA